MYYYENSLSLDALLEASKSQSVDAILKYNYEKILTNTVFENYEYNMTHYESKSFDYSLFIPEGLSSKIESVELQFEKQTNPEMTPMYDSVASSGLWGSREETQSIPVSATIISPEFSWETLTGSIMLERSDFTLEGDYNNFEYQVFLNLKDGSSLPYSPMSYFYISGNTLEGKKNSLTSAYYQSQGDVGYPNIERLLSAQFEKLEVASDGLEDYISNLEKVEVRVQNFVENYNKAGDEIANKVSDEMSFQENIAPYGENMRKINLLNDVLWQIRSEVETRKSTDIIDEIFQIQN